MGPGQASFEFLLFTNQFGLNSEIEKPGWLWDGDMVLETRMDQRGVRGLVLYNPIYGICKKLRIRV